MKIIVSIICCLGFYSAFSFSDTIITPKDFKNIIGCWKGTITYLDYTSNKSFSMPVQLIVKDYKSSNNIIYSLIYPEEPAANSIDTLFISAEGRAINNKLIIVKDQHSEDSITVLTEIRGMDGNNNKPALIRHIYTLGKNCYSIKKEVQFIGQNTWILRCSYTFMRAKLCK